MTWTGKQTLNKGPHVRGQLLQGLLVVALTLVGLHTSAYPTLSPIDELQHIDYVIRAGELEELLLVGHQPELESLGSILLAAPAAVSLHLSSHGD